MYVSNGVSTHHPHSWHNPCPARKVQQRWRQSSSLPHWQGRPPAPPAPPPGGAPSYGPIVPMSVWCNLWSPESGERTGASVFAAEPWRPLTAAKALVTKLLLGWASHFGQNQMAQDDVKWVQAEATQFLYDEMIIWTKLSHGPHIIVNNAKARIIWHRFRMVQVSIKHKREVLRLYIMRKINLY